MNQIENDAVFFIFVEKSKGVARLLCYKILRVIIIPVEAFSPIPFSPTIRPAGCYQNFHDRCKNFPDVSVVKKSLTIKN